MAGSLDAGHIADLFLEDETKQQFREIRNYLAGRMVGATRDAALMDEVLKCLFCRVRLELENWQGTDNSIALAKRYRSAYQQVKTLVPDLFPKDDELMLDPESLAFVDQKLSTMNLCEPNRDPVGDLYEAFVASEMQGREGQFFTPQAAVSWLVEAICPQPGEDIIDPACGAGGFLSYAARSLRKSGEISENIAKCLYGIDKDEYLAGLARAHIALTTLNNPNILCGDSLAWKDENGEELDSNYLGQFDVVLTNPPFGAKIATNSNATDGQLSLAYKWKRDRTTGIWNHNGVIRQNTPPQILFIERCMRLLRPEGRMGIVIPESVVSSPSHSYAIQYLQSIAHIDAVIGMPESLFKTSGKGGTHAKTCLIIARKKAYEHEKSTKHVFMAEAKWCGHDSRGNPIDQNDLPEILERYKNNKRINSDSRGYFVDVQKLQGTVLAPRYYDPEPAMTLDALFKTHELISVGDLVNQGVLEFRTGDEVGKLSYGNNEVPFVRTSDISNWEIKLDPKHGISKEEYHRLREKQDVRAGDLLMVRDGTYLIGSCAFISKYDEEMVYQSHIYKIRVCKPSVISPYLLLAVLSSEPVRQQIKAKRFTQDIIDSIGKRVYELVLPVPRSQDARKQVEDKVKKSINDRIEARELARQAKIDVA